MTTSDNYQTIRQPSISELREKASKFLGYAFPLSDKGDWQKYLEEVKRSHPKATHHCYAFRFGQGTDLFRANDDGEPSGSAGKPILGQIDSFGLANILIVVVRYYGGTKLGVPGLIHAYREAARLALDSSEIVDGYYMTKVKITAPYQAVPDIMNIGKHYEWQMGEQHYNDHGQIIIAEIREGHYRPFWEDLQIKAGGLYPDDVKEGKTSPYLEIERIQDND